MEYYTPKDVLEGIGQENDETQASYWRQCEWVLLGWELSKAGKWVKDNQPPDKRNHNRTWANDIAEEIGIKRRAVYERKNALLMRILFNGAFDKERVDRAAKRGFSYFTIAWQYRKDTILLELLDAIEMAHNLDDLKFNLSDRFGSGTDEAGRINKFSQYVTDFLGMAEFFKAPEPVRHALANLQSALSEWNYG